MNDFMREMQAGMRGGNDDGWRGRNRDDGYEPRVTRYSGGGDRGGLGGFGGGGGGRSSLSIGSPHDVLGESQIFAIVLTHNYSKDA